MENKPEALMVGIVAHEDDNVDLICPHCNAANLFNEIDISERWNTMASASRDEEGTLQVSWYVGETNYDHARFICDNCNNPVLLPEGYCGTWD